MSDPTPARQRLLVARRVVVKIGSALLARAGAAPGSADDPFVRLSREIGVLHARGIEVVVVSSGAIALGLSALQLTERPRDLASLQAAAAAGQSRLMREWDDAFARPDGTPRRVAQVLLTHGDLRDRRRYLNARQALLRLLEAGVVPIINENDTVAVEEIKVGDNDTLAAEVCGLVSAQVVVLLTGAAGLFTADPSIDPNATRIPVVTAVDQGVMALAGPAAALGTGGMITKLTAAVAAQRHGAATVIAPGKEPGILRRIFDGDDVGTVIEAPAEAREGARKRWIATTLRPRATVRVDAGAERALKKNASLLFAGVASVEGTFLPGDAIAVADANGVVFARGLARVSSTVANQVKGMKTAAARAQSTEPLPDELVHRDDLVLL